MMGTGGTSPAWLLVVFFWVVLIGVIVFLLIRLLPDGRQGWAGARRGQAPSEPPEEVLDRMFALGELDEATYRARRTALTEMRGPR